MRKNIKIFLLIVICSFLCVNKVKADTTNYSEGSIIKNSSDCTGSYCIVDNNNYLIIQARLNYLNVSDFENVGKTYYFVNTNAYNYLKNYDLNLIEISQFNSYSGENRYQNAINYLTNNYLNNETNGKDMLNKLTGFNDYTSVLIKDIEKTSGSTKGYRILLEPSLVISNVDNKNNTAVYTIKGIASKIETTLSTKLGTYYNQTIKVFDNNTSDSNSSLFNGSEDKCKGYNNQTLADYKVKCLYKMYNVDDYISKDGNYTCYSKTIDVKNGGIKCVNWDKNNEEEYIEKYSTYLCKTTISERKQNNIYGKKIIEETGTCKLYCKEKLSISFPGNISIPEQKGTYFAWPTTSLGGKYNMSVKTTLDCTIVDDGGATTSSATMIRTCAAGTYNHPTNPDKCISNATTAKVCDLRVTEQVGNTCYTLVNPSNTKVSTTETTNERICASGWTTVASSGNKACRISTNERICPSGYTATGQSGNNACRKTEKTNSRVCASGWVTQADGRCMTWDKKTPLDIPTTCYDGRQYVDSQCWRITTPAPVVGKSCSIYETPVGNGYCRHYYGASCPSGYALYNPTDGLCYKNTSSTYYTYSGGTCEPACKNSGGTQVNTSYCRGANYCCCRYAHVSYGTSSRYPTCPSGTYNVGGGFQNPTCYNDVPPTCPAGYSDNGNGTCSISGNEACGPGGGYHPYVNNELYGHSNGSGAYVDLRGKCHSDGNTGSCPNGTLYYYMAGPIPVYRCKNVCPSGYFYSNGQCLKDVYIGPTACPSGYSGSDCSKYVYSAKTECPSGYTKSGSACYKYQAKTECPSGYYKSGNSCLKNVEAYCGSQTNKNYNYAIVNGQKYCCSSGSVKTASYSSKCRSTSVTQNKICPYNDGKQYYTADNSSTSVCRLISNKNNITYTCPEGFTKNGTTCTNDCNGEVKEKFKTRIEEMLNNPKFESYLKVNDSNRKINDKLETYNIKTTLLNSDRQDGQLKSFTLESKYNVRMNENINRFYNKITNEVSDVNKTGYYDRGEGVISLTRTINTFGLNNKINDYKMEISDFKNVGIDDTFDDLLNGSSYICQYRITDKSNCKCPIGTKNEGDSVYNLSAYIKSENPKVIASNTDVTSSCVELQKKYCNYEIEEEYCKKDDGTKVNITDCIKNQTNKTYEEAYSTCEKENCKSNNNYCSKNCLYVDKQIGNTVYTIQKCNNNTEICGFYLHCIDEKETSQSYLDLVSQRVNTKNIVITLRNGLYNGNIDGVINNIESSIRSLDSNICGIKKNSKAVYREIDLENPFPGKSGEIRESGYNWKSEQIINEIITDNRGATTNQIYNKEPIYTITLTPQIINKIREYNKNNTYEELLKCNDNVCISDFIHGNDNSLKSMGILSGISNCTTLNASSSSSAFNSCYNENN